MVESFKPPGHDTCPLQVKKPAFCQYSYLGHGRRSYSQHLVLRFFFVFPLHPTLWGNYLLY